MVTAAVAAVASLALLPASVSGESSEDDVADALDRVAIAIADEPRPAPSVVPIRTVFLNLPVEGDWPPPRGRAVATTEPPAATAQGSGAAADPGAPPSAAPLPAPEDGPARRERLGREALQRMRFDWRGLGWEAEFGPGRPGRLGFANRDRRVVEVYIRDDHTVDRVAATLAHELTHVIDYERLRPSDRNRWLRVRGLEGVRWWPRCSCDDRAYGAGDLAEAAAMLVAGSGHWTGDYAAPTPAQLRVAAELLGWR